MAGFQFNLSAVAPIAAISSGPDPEHVGGPRLQPVHRHHVGARLQNGVVLLPLVLKWRKEQDGEEMKHQVQRIILSVREIKWLRITKKKI